MEFRSTSSVPSGDPVSIFVLSQSATSIAVKESGAEETARITFVVQDSAGIPVDLEHSVDVHFKFGALPGGGELLSPTVVKTNNSGQAAVNLTSGTKAGVVQIIAEITIGSTKITSLPVVISIHEGLPDFDHFSIFPRELNFVGLNFFESLLITVIVGDKYANPVRPNTSVYFTTTGGIIEGSIQTNSRGMGTVNLYSALPYPNHPVFGPGFATVTATTADENSLNISREIIVLFSTVPLQMSASPTSFSIPEGGIQAFTYTLSDQNSNPLAGGTSIKVTVDGEDVKTQGDVDIILPDTQSRSWTQFSFVVFDAKVDTLVNQYTPVVISIKSEGPNGKASLILTGNKD